MHVVAFAGLQRLIEFTLDSSHDDRDLYIIKVIEHKHVEVICHAPEDLISAESDVFVNSYFEML